MNAMDQILALEADEEDRCEKCTEFRNGYQGPYCVLMRSECSPWDICGSYELSDFWKTKRGY